MNKMRIFLSGVCLANSLYAAKPRDLYELVRAATNDGKAQLMASELARKYGTGSVGSKKILDEADSVVKQVEAEFDGVNKRLAELEQATKDAFPHDADLPAAPSGVTRKPEDLPKLRIQQLIKQRDDAQAALKAIVTQLGKSFSAIEQAVMAR